MKTNELNSETMRYKMQNFQNHLTLAKENGFYVKDGKLVSDLHPTEGGTVFWGMQEGETPYTVKLDIDPADEWNWMDLIELITCLNEVHDLFFINDDTAE